MSHAKKFISISINPPHCTDRCTENRRTYFINEPPVNNTVFCANEILKDSSLPNIMTENEACFKIGKNEKVGRFALASRDYKPGELIFTEEPFAYGPKPDQPAMCLGCYLPIDFTYMCSKCKWPVCGPDCEVMPAHRDAECQVFAEADLAFQSLHDATIPCLQYECITPLRVLLAKEKNPQRWNKELEEMQSHDEERKKLPTWNYDQVNIVGYLRGPCKLDHFSEELIHRICGILEINVFEAPPPKGGWSIRCIYPKLSIPSHNCVPNITHTITNDYKVIVRAAVHIKANEELFSCYTDPVWPTLARRTFLKQSKYFECECPRCADPTELGTHMGTIKCSKCDNGIILSTAPLDFNAVWKCTHCPFSTIAPAVLRVYQALQDDIDKVDAHVEDAAKAIEARESLYRKYRSVMHPRNSYHTMLRVSLAQMYGKVDGYRLDELPDVLLERKYEMCQALLQNFDIIKPGYTKIRGIIMYELHAPIIMLARNLYRTSSIDKKELRKRLDQAIELLRQSSDILTLEPIETVEGQLGQVALSAMQQLKGNINELVDADL